MRTWPSRRRITSARLCFRASKIHATDPSTDGWNQFVSPFSLDPSDLAVAASQMDINGPVVIDLNSESPKTDRGRFQTPPRAPIKKKNQEQSATAGSEET
jgi:hypothetical protein